MVSQAGAAVQCFAPEVNIQAINHISGDPMLVEQRNTLLEAARLVRGQIANVAQANADDFDALIVPGGYGAAKNLSNYAVAGIECELQSDFLNFAKKIHQSNKPIGLICIAPVMAPHICGQGVSCTIGNDANVAKDIVTMGGVHVDCLVTDIHIDTNKKLVTTPAYMLAETIADAAIGIQKLVNQILTMA